MRPTKAQVRKASKAFNRLPLKVKFWVSIMIVGVLLITTLVWLGKHNWDADAAFDSLHPGTAVSTGFAGSGVEQYSTAHDVLETLEVHELSEKTGYSRKLFGDAWEDVDRNGCDTRNDVLARDLTELHRDNRCRVLTGVLVDPYTGDHIDFVRGEKTSSEVPVDHVVALSNAWQTGATLLSEDERTMLANDPLNLQATLSLPNTSKSDQDASHWLPQSGYRCEYVARQVSVKATYSLWVTPAEKKAMQQVLTTCPDQPAYRSPLVGK